ncbi:MAG TPA: low molecular weight phosphatase family protein [Actinomycetota bacterium]|nr:low molecular weight phosphatase family protein [Actinomycetota bacterium]
MEKPMVLFVCVHNAGRSRIAEALFNRMAGDRYRAISAGTHPASAPHPEVVESLEDAGISISGPGKLLTSALAGSAARVIGMGCDVDEACPALKVPLEDWDLPDPKGKSRAQVDEVRDEIRARVEGLVAELDAERGGG